MYILYMLITNSALTFSKFYKTFRNPQSLNTRIKRGKGLKGLKWRTFRLAKYSHLLSYGAYLSIVYKTKTAEYSRALYRNSYQEVTLRATAGVATRKLYMYSKTCKCKRSAEVYNNERCYRSYKYRASYVSTDVKGFKIPQSKSGQIGNAAEKIVVPIYYSSVIPIADQQYSIMDNKTVMDTEYNLQYPLLGQRKGNISSYTVSKMRSLSSGTKWYIEYSRYRE
jgi:hypothetical protein